MVELTAELKRPVLAVDYKGSLES